MRIRLPDLRTLPSSTVATLSARPTSATVAPLPLNENADERAATRSPPILARTFSSSSARPSAKYSFSSSRLMLTNGSTAIDGGSWRCGAGTDAVAGTTRGGAAGGDGASTPDSSRCTRSANAAGAAPADRRVHCTSRNFSGTRAFTSIGGVDDHRHEERLVVRHVQRASLTANSIRGESSLRCAGLCVGRDDRNEQRAFLDLPPDRRVPRVATAQLALVEPHVEAARARSASQMRRRGVSVLRCVTEKDCFRWRRSCGIESEIGLAARAGQLGRALKARSAPIVTQIRPKPGGEGGAPFKGSPTGGPRYLLTCGNAAGWRQLRPRFFQRPDAFVRCRRHRRRRRRHDVRGAGGAARPQRAADRALPPARREDPHLRRRPLQLHQYRRRSGELPVAESGFLPLGARALYAARISSRWSRSTASRITRRSSGNCSATTRRSRSSAC